MAEKNKFALDVIKIREQAQQQIEAGATVQHAVAAPERVSQLGGSPDFEPATLVTRAHTEYAVPDEADLTRMLKENLVAERIVITSYQEIIRWIGDAEPTTRRTLEHILEEEEHADDLTDLLGNKA